MKSLKKNSSPFSNNLFTNEIVEYIIEEGFEVRENDSYAESRKTKENNLCYKKYEDGNGVDIYIYICEDGIEIDQDLDCGGNLNTYFIPFNDSFESVYDDMVHRVNEIKCR